VSDNIIDASWEALRDAADYKLMSAAANIQHPTSNTQRPTLAQS
jgi:hypothetical protein